uniref:Uncharacterized protein n=1 Tax=Anguilla anguilla TaxID=7936 RepID=A0A0E9PD85_ANGAN
MLYIVSSIKRKGRLTLLACETPTYNQYMLISFSDFHYI